MRTLPRAIGCGLLAIAGLLGVPSVAAAQEVSAAALKAAFLANFAKFTQWPDGALGPGQPLTFCVVGDRGVADALRKTVKASPDHPVSVTEIKPDAPIRLCHVLYVGGTDGRLSATVIEAARGTAIFTAGESEQFAESGGVAQLLQDHGRMRFAINLAAAQRARIVLSAQLLNLAIIVEDHTYATR